MRRTKQESEQTRQQILDAAQRERLVQQIPLKRLGDPRELADTIVWLASERASYVTGQTVLVDGGMYKGL